MAPDFIVNDQKMPVPDILVIPGGKQELLVHNEVLRRYLEEAVPQSAYVVMLGNSLFAARQIGEMDSISVTAFPGNLDQLKNAYPNMDVMDKVSFVHDGKFISSVGGALSYEPALYLTEMLFGRKVAQQVAERLVITWRVGMVPYGQGPNALKYQPAWLE